MIKNMKDIKVSEKNEIYFFRIGLSQRDASRREGCPDKKKMVERKLETKLIFRAKRATLKTALCGTLHFNTPVGDYDQQT